MAKEANISVLSPRFRYSWRRTGPVRKMFDDIGQVPVVGPLVNNTVGEMILNRQPLEVWRRKMDKKNHLGTETDIPFGTDNRTMMMTTALDSLFFLWDKNAWADERRSMAEGLRAGVYDEHGDFSYDTWLRARSSLGPKVLSNLVQGALGPEQKPVPHFTEIMNLFEHSELPHNRRTEFLTDVGITLTSLLGPGLADYVLLKLLPTTQEIVPNPEIMGNVVAGGAAGATAGVLAGLAIDALPGKDLGKVPKTLIPIATAVMGMLGANWYTQEFVVPGIEQTVQVTHIPLNEYGWTIPVVSAAGAMVFGYPRFRKHKENREAIAHQLDDLKGWRSMFAIMANSVDYMRQVQGFAETHPVDPAKKGDVARAIYTKNPALNVIVENFNHRDPDHVRDLQDQAGTTLKDLAEQVLFTEMVSFNQGYADRSVSGGANPTIKGFIPRADDYFGSLNEEGLKAASQCCDLVKTLGDKKDWVAALSVISPTIPQIMISQSQMGDLGATDDTMHFGEAGMNTGTRGAFVYLTEATINRMLTVPDSKRAELTNKLKELGALYKRSIPIGGLDRIYTPPAHLQLGALYGYALMRSRPHRLSDPGDPATHGEYGSKGLLSDVGKAALGAMKENPLVTYMFMADIATAIENSDALLVNVATGTKRVIVNGLKSLQREIATAIIRERFPADKQTAVKFFTDGQYAFEAYTALTMLTEVCGNNVIEPIVAKQAAVLSPLFAEADLTIANPKVVDERRFPSVVKFNGIVGDTPNLYSTQLIDFVHNARRHGTHIHAQLAEFLQRGMLPRLVKEYLDRMRPEGRGESFNEEQLKNTVEFAGYAFESLECEDMIPLAAEFIQVLEAINRVAPSSVAPMGSLSKPSADIQTKANEAYRRTQAALAVANRLLNAWKSELHIPIPGAHGAGAVRTFMDTRMEKLVQEISQKTANAMSTRVVFP